jgi:hypothetical protein
MTETEADVLAVYSTPGLRKCGFTREGKRDWLAYAYPTMPREEVVKLLDELYGDEVYGMVVDPARRFS